MQWIKGDVPVDMPSCGYKGELCVNDDNQQKSETLAVALGILLFCVSIVTLSIYRKWKIEMEIEGLLWKINLSEINGYAADGTVTSSKVPK